MRIFVGFLPSCQCTLLLNTTSNLWHQTKLKVIWICLLPWAINYGVQNTLIESKTVMNDFANELLRLRDIESDDTYIKQALKHQKAYQDALREEFQLKRMNRGLWWSVIKNSFRTK